MYFWILYIALSGLFFSTSVQAEGPVGGQFTDDWSKVAAAAKEPKIPIMVIFSNARCAYCDRLKDQLIHPMVQRGDFSDRALVQEYDVDQEGKIIDFDGESIRARIFVNRYHIFATPTVIMLDAQGNPMGAPLVGYNGQEDYLPLLTHAIEDSINLLQGPDRDPGFASSR